MYNIYIVKWGLCKEVVRQTVTFAIRRPIEQMMCSGNTRAHTHTVISQRRQKANRSLLVSCQRPIGLYGDMNSSSLESLNYGYKFSPQFGNIRRIDNSQSLEILTHGIAVLHHSSIQILKYSLSHYFLDCACVGIAIELIHLCVCVTHQKCLL